LAVSAANEGAENATMATVARRIFFMVFTNCCAFERGGKWSRPTKVPAETDLF
jgi:hypothetical protein